MMNKEEILQQIKNDFSKEQGFEDWEDYYYEEGADFNEHELDIIATRFAIYMCNLQKSACCEASLIEYKDGDHIRAIGHIEVDGEIVSINRQSILNTKNVAE